MTMFQTIEKIYSTSNGNILYVHENTEMASNLLRQEILFQCDDLEDGLPFGKNHSSAK